MAEVGLAASLLGIASFGVQLTTTLYRFGSTASAAREQTDYIARHVTLYADVLELLAQRIDEDEPIHSPKALALVDEIYDQSADLFDKIKDLLPNRKDKVNFLQKIKWNFKKIKVDLLVAEIEYLKTTVTLLVSVLYAGKKIRRHKRRRRSKEAEHEVEIQLQRAENAVLEQLNASAARDHLQAKVEEEDEQEASRRPEGEFRPQTSSALVKHVQPISILESNTAVVRFKNTIDEATSLPEERSLVIRHSAGLIEELLHQWTTLAESARESIEDENVGARASPFRDPTPRGDKHTKRNAEGSGSLPYQQESRHAEDQDTFAEKYRASENRARDLENALSKSYRESDARARELRESHAQFIQLEDSRKQSENALQEVMNRHSQSQARVRLLEAELSRLKVQRKPEKEARNRERSLSTEAVTRIPDHPSVEPTRPREIPPVNVEDNREAQERLTNGKKRESSKKAHASRAAQYDNTYGESVSTKISPGMKLPRYEYEEPVNSRRPAETSRLSSSTVTTRDKEEETSDQRWERHHEESKAYMAKATQRPSLERDAYQYWSRA